MIAKRYSEKKVFKSISRNSVESTYNHNTALFLTWSTVLQHITKNRTSLQLFYYEFDNIFQSSYSPGTSEWQQSQSFWRQSCRNLIFRWVPLTNYFSALIFQYLHIVTINSFRFKGGTRICVRRVSSAFVSTASKRHFYLSFSAALLEHYLVSFVLTR